MIIYLYELTLEKDLEPLIIILVYKKIEFNIKHQFPVIHQRLESNLNENFNNQNI